MICQNTLESENNNDVYNIYSVCSSISIPGPEVIKLFHKQLKIIFSYFSANTFYIFSTVHICLHIVDQMDNQALRL